MSLDENESMLAALALNLAGAVIEEGGARAALWRLAVKLEAGEALASLGAPWVSRARHAGEDEGDDIADWLKEAVQAALPLMDLTDKEIKERVKHHDVWAFVELCRRTKREQPAEKPRPKKRGNGHKRPVADEEEVA